MSRGFQGALMRGFGARDHVATVTGTQWLAPHFLRVRLTSPTLFDDIEVETTTWLRFWFPDPDGGETEYQRAYTLTEADPNTGTFAVDFVLHTPAGPACLWAERAQPGDTVPVMTSLTAGFTVPEELPAGLLLVGDAASIPAIKVCSARCPRRFRSSCTWSGTAPTTRRSRWAATPGCGCIGPTAGTPGRWLPQSRRPTGRTGMPGQHPSRGR